MSISSNDSLKNFLSFEVYDRASQTASYLLKDEKFTKTQLENIIQAYLNIPNSRESVKTLIAFIGKQHARNKIKSFSATSNLINNLKEMLNSFKTDDELNAAIMKYLNIVKWIYEALDKLQKLEKRSGKREKIKVNNFNEFMDVYLTRE